MSIVNGYTTLAAIKDSLKIDSADTADDSMLERAIESASRMIDAATERRFWQDGTVVARYYSTSRPLGDLDTDDISTATGLLVATDEAGDGLYSTSWTITTDFQLEPLNAAAESPVQPWTRIGVAWNSGKVWPTYREGAIKVTAKFGWPAVPTAVAQACLVQAGRLYSRRHSPAGIAGWADNPMLIPWRPDPDVERLVAPFRRWWGIR